MVTTRWISGIEDYSQTLALRKQVFTGELKAPEDGAPDGYDDMSWHLLILEGGAPAATGRVFIENSDAYIGRICVSGEYRGLQLGDLVVRMLLTRAQKLGAVDIYVRSRNEVIGFYKKFGFTCCAKDTGSDSHTMLSVKSSDVVLPRECEN